MPATEPQGPQLGKGIKQTMQILDRLQLHITLAAHEEGLISIAMC